MRKNFKLLFGIILGTKSNQNRHRIVVVDG